jgi:outer membrane lipoprotein-sorting protein
MNCFKTLTLLYITILIILSTEASACSQHDIEVIENALNNSRSISAHFVENNEKTGNIYIKKPGMMRIDYDMPEKISILIKDSFVTYYDHKLDELTKIKQDPKFLTFLTRDNIDFKRDFERCECKKKDKEIILSLLLTGQEKEKINLQMYYSQYILNKVDIKIDNGKETTLVFSNMTYKAELKNDRFILKDKAFFNIE